MRPLLTVQEGDGALLTGLVTARDLTAVEAAQLERETARLPDAAVVVFDLSRVVSVDGAGIGALVRWQRRLTEQGRQLRLAAPSRDVNTVFQLLRLHRLFEVYDRVDEAVSDPGLAAP